LLFDFKLKLRYLIPSHLSQYDFTPFSFSNVKPTHKTEIAKARNSFPW